MMKLAVTGLLLALTVCNTGTFSVADEIDIKLNFSRGQQHRVEMQFEHEGKIIMQQDTDEAEDEFRSLPMKTVARLGYHQRFTGKGGQLQAIRYYDQAKGRFAILEGKTGASLTDPNRLVVVRVKSKTDKPIQMASVTGTLAQFELELLRNPLDPLSIGSLINKEGVSTGDQWKPADIDLASFLSVDRIIRNDVKIKLKKIERSTAILHVTGKLRAAIDDVSTEMEIASVMKVRLKNRQELSVAKLNLREIRQPGQIAPGYDGKSSITLELKPDDSCPQLSSASLAKLTKDRVIEQRLQWQSPGLKLKYDPRWRVIAAENEAAVMRFVSDGNLMAQCNIIQLPARPADQPLSLKEYRQEVGKIIAADEIANIVEADEFTTDQAVRGLSVEVEGEEDGVAVSWIYYHMNGPDGRRLTFVFTLERDIANAFRPADRKMVEGLVFSTRPNTKAQKVSEIKRSTKADQTVR